LQKKNNCICCSTKGAPPTVGWRSNPTQLQWDQYSNAVALEKLPFGSEAPATEAEF